MMRDDQVNSRPRLCSLPSNLTFKFYASLKMPTRVGNWIASEYNNKSTQMKLGYYFKAECFDKNLTFISFNYMLQYIFQIAMTDTKY